jgi:hypothetical protein
MKIQDALSKPAWLWATFGLAGSLLIGCGGNDSGAAVSTDQVASVQLTDTASGMSVKTVLAGKSANAVAASASGASAPAGGGHDATDTSVSARVQYTFTATSNGAVPLPDSLAAGTLVLHSETKASGALEVEGRLILTAAGTQPPPPDAAAIAAFKAKKAELRTALTVGLDAAKTAYDAAVADPAITPAAKAAARATFKAAVAKAISDFQAAVTAAAQQFGVSLAKTDRGLEVEGTLDAAGLLTLKGEGKKSPVIVLTATTTLPAVPLGADLSGTFTVDGVAAGTWTAPAQTTATPVAPV